EKFGPRVRLFKVFTDLPLSYDSYEPFGVTEFCRVCKKCAIHCPSQAIPYGDMTTEGHNISNHSGVLKWYSNYEKCFQFWAKIRTDCANCIRVCPFNKPEGLLHDLVRWHIKHFPRLDSPIVKIDDLLGYGKQKRANRYWN
ncbi:MAG: 4Fe-4S dicluster domain-containing protein, partial [Proteobacteria bacterium]|nr:4Fe-4S dicluster domain-containing protein [Pseudomonadota bacterium]